MSTEGVPEKPAPEVVVETETLRQKAEKLKDMDTEERGRVVQGNLDALRYGGGKIKLTPEEAKASTERKRRLEENQERAA